MPPGMIEYVGSGVARGRDVVGIEEIVGADLATIIGAVSQDVISRLADVRAAGGVAVVKRDGNMKVKPLPFGFISLATTISGNVECTAQEQYRPDRLVITAPEFVVVNSLVITTKSQFAAAGSVPGVIFAFNAWGVRVEFDTIPVGGKATMNITNIDANTHVFYSAFVGISIG